MSNLEHLIENAIYDVGNKITYEQWVEDEKRRGNSDGVSSHDLKLIWTCAEYVIFSLFTTRGNFHSWVDGGMILDAEEYEEYLKYARNQ